MLLLTSHHAHPASQKKLKIKTPQMVADGHCYLLCWTQGCRQPGSCSFTCLFHLFWEDRHSLQFHACLEHMF